MFSPLTAWHPPPPFPTNRPWQNANLRGTLSLVPAELCTLWCIDPHLRFPILSLRALLGNFCQRMEGSMLQFLWHQVPQVILPFPFHPYSRGNLIPGGPCRSCLLAASRPHQGISLSQHGVCHLGRRWNLPHAFLWPFHRHQGRTDVQHWDAAGGGGTPAQYSEFVS